MSTPARPFDDVDGALVNFVAALRGLRAVLAQARCSLAWADAERVATRLVAAQTQVREAGAALGAAITEAEAEALEAFEAALPEALRADVLSEVLAVATPAGRPS